MNLQKAIVIGFFSLPSPSLAEQNPNAYNNARAAAPVGAGSCGHCGMGIMHHVVIRLEDGTTGFIGTTCAEKVDDERVQCCVRQKLTEEQLRERERKADELRARREAEEAFHDRRIAARYELLKDILDVLEGQQTEFHSSLAQQLRLHCLSERQAVYVAKAVVGRYTKKSEEQWNAVVDRCLYDDEAFEKVA
jgi:hypothetical protein